MVLIPASNVNTSTTVHLLSVSRQDPTIVILKWINWDIQSCQYLVLIQAETSGVPRSGVWIAEVKVRGLTYERGQ